MKNGFTLIELVITLAILALLATAAAPVMHLSAQRTKEQALRRALWDLRDAIDAYKQAGDDGLIARPADRSGYPPTLNVLVEGVDNIQNPAKGKVFFLRQIPRDPFALDHDAPAADTWGKRSYASPHDEPKEGDDVYDVYSLASGVGLDSRPYREW